MTEKLIINGEEIENWKELSGLSLEEDGMAIELPDHRLINTKNCQSFIVELTTSDELDNLSSVLRGLDTDLLEFKKCRILIQVIGNVKPQRE